MYIHPCARVCVHTRHQAVRVSLPATTMSGSAGASCCPAPVSQSLELVRVYGSPPELPALPTYHARDGEPEERAGELVILERIKRRRRR